MNVRHLASMIALAFCGACSDATAPTPEPEPEPSRYFTFNYEGALSGSFQGVGGTPSPNSHYTHRSFAAAYPLGYKYVIIAYDSLQATHGNYVIAYVDTTSTLPSRVSDSCLDELELGQPCSRFELFVNGDIDSDSDFGTQHDATSGTFTLQSATPGEITGVFQGSITSPSITITQGRFRIPLDSYYRLYARLPRHVQLGLAASLARHGYILERPGL
jgi:hypothetical protein